MFTCVNLFSEKPPCLNHSLIMTPIIKTEINKNTINTITTFSNDDNKENNNNQGGWKGHSPSYKFGSIIGSGSYGVVYQAYDSQNNNTKVAIKLISNIFDKTSLTKRTMREIKLLKQVKSHPNIICLKDIFTPSSSIDHLNLVFEHMDTDLNRLIHSNQHLSRHHVQYFMYQILCGVNYLHTYSIVHRDLKPANIFLNANCKMKIGDLGLARFLQRTAVLCNPATTETELKVGLQKTAVAVVGLQGTTVPATAVPCLTDHIMSRWYRAPEIILLTKHYTHAVDMWSIGCIFAELLQTFAGPPDQRRALFPGKTSFPLSSPEDISVCNDPSDQLNIIFDIIGTPSIEDIQMVENETAKSYLSQLKQKESKCFKTIFSYANDEEIDLLERLLQFNPTKRITAKSTLLHSYFRDMLDETYLREGSYPTIHPEWDKSNHDIEFMKHIIQEEVYSYGEKGLRPFQPPLS